MIEAQADTSEVWQEEANIPGRLNDGSMDVQTPEPSLTGWLGVGQGGVNPQT